MSETIDIGDVKHNGSGRRLLAVPPPGARLEKVVREALAEVAHTRSDAIKKAEEAIAEYGLTIEVVRLRDRLHRLALTELDKLLLATPGVPEELFYEAIKTELDEMPDSDLAEDIAEDVDAIREALEGALAEDVAEDEVVHGIREALEGFLGKLTGIVRTKMESPASTPTSEAGTESAASTPTSEAGTESAASTPTSEAKD